MTDLITLAYSNSTPKNNLPLVENISICELLKRERGQDWLVLICVARMANISPILSYYGVM